MAPRAPADETSRRAVTSQVIYTTYTARQDHAETPDSATRDKDRNVAGRLGYDSVAVAVAVAVAVLPTSSASACGGLRPSAASVASNIG